MKKILLLAVLLCGCQSPVEPDFWCNHSIQQVPIHGELDYWVYDGKLEVDVTFCVEPQTPEYWVP